MIGIIIWGLFGVATNPMEIIKIRMQTALVPNKTKPSALTIVNELGIRGVYKGTCCTLLR